MIGVEINLKFLFLEFLDVGKLKPALEVLSDVLRSKKHRTWQKVHEPIIEQYLNLCVELRKSQAAKEGLYQYKIICQQVGFQSSVLLIFKTYVLRNNIQFPLVMADPDKSDIG